MTIAMWWFIAGVTLLVVAALWLFGPYGLAGGGVLCLGAGYALVPVDGEGGSMNEGS